MTLSRTIVTCDLLHGHQKRNILIQTLDYRLVTSIRREQSDRETARLRITARCRLMTSVLLRKIPLALFLTVISAGTTIPAQTPTPSRITGDQIRILTNIQTGSSYTVVPGDCGKPLSFANASPVTVTLPQAGIVIPAGCWIEMQNSGTGAVTITPNVSLIDGSAALQLATGAGVQVVSSSGQYYTQRGSSGSGTVNSASTGQLGYYPAGGAGVSGSGCIVGGLLNADLTCESFTTTGSLAGEVDLYPPASSTSYIGLVAPASIPTTYTLQLPGTAPSNQLLSFGAPASGVSTGSWINVPTGGGTSAGSVYCLGSGTNTISCAGTPAPSSYITGMTVSLLAGGSNTGPVTLNIASIGPVSVLLNGTSLAAGQIIFGYSYSLYYDGAEFNVVYPIVPGLQITFSTTAGTCSPSCTAAATGYGPAAILPGITVTDNYGLAAGWTRVITGSDTSGGTAPYPEWGGASASASFRDVLNNANSVLIPFTAAAAGTLTDALPGMGAPGAPGANGTNGAAGASGASGAAGATGPPGPVSLVANPQSSTYQALPADFASCKSIPVSAGTFTITLVASTAQPASGQCILILNYGSGVVTVAQNGQYINGSAASQILVAGTASAPSGLLVISDGANYEAQPLGRSGGGGSTTTGASITTPGLGWFCASYNCQGAIAVSPPFSSLTMRYQQFVIPQTYRYGKLIFYIEAVDTTSASNCGGAPCGFLGAIYDSTCTLIAGASAVTNVGLNSGASAKAYSFATPANLAAGVYFFGYTSDSTSLQLYSADNTTLAAAMLNLDSTTNVRYFTGSNLATGHNSGLTPPGGCGTRTAIATSQYPEMFIVEP